MATHSSILAWRIPWTEEPGGPRGQRESDTTEVTKHTRTHATLSQVMFTFYVYLNSFYSHYFPSFLLL